MKKAWIGIAVLTLAGLVTITPAQARRVPPGSYLQTCRQVRWEPGRLFAVCRRRNGSWRHSELFSPHRCGGDIANIDGRLRCS